MKLFLIKPKIVFWICVTLVIASCDYPVPTPMQPDQVEIMPEQLSDIAPKATEVPIVTPTATGAPTGIPTLTVVPAVTIVPTATEVLSPIVVRYRIPFFDCDNGHAVSTTIDLDISGGKAPYTTYPEFPIFAAPGTLVSFFIESDTPDGEPSGTITFMVPPRTSFDCKNRSSSGGGSGYHQATTDPDADPPCPAKPNGKIPKKCDKKNKK